MAIIDIVKHEQRQGEIVHKFPSCDLRWGSQLVVYPGQTAVFTKGGEVCDMFTEGTYTLHTNNVPLLNNLVNLPFGGDSPFQADVWFVSTINRLDLKWGTETAILLEDPKYEILVPVRAYGQYGFRVGDVARFMRGLVGNMSAFDERTLQAYFRGLLLNRLTEIVAKKITKEQISVLDINTRLGDISQEAQQELKPYFEDFGIEILLFNIISINVPEDDPSIAEIRKAKNLSARLKITGTDNYKLERLFDVLEKAAENESGTGAAIVNAGVGLGAALGVGKHIGDALSPSEPPKP